eukprot:12608163-Ditylum_brightwellii.AAC.1
MSKQESSKYSKGDEICFFNGQYKWRMGWLNSSRSVSGNRIHVIVDMGGGKERQQVYQFGVALNIILQIQQTSWK